MARPGCDQRDEQPEDGERHDGDECPSHWTHRPRLSPRCEGSCSGLSRHAWSDSRNILRMSNSERHSPMPLKITGTPMKCRRSRNAIQAAAPYKIPIRATMIRILRGWRSSQSATRPNGRPIRSWAGSSRPRWLAQAATSGMSTQTAENATTAVSVQPKGLMKGVFPASGSNYRACQAFATPCQGCHGPGLTAAISRGSRGGRPPVCKRLSTRVCCSLSGHVPWRGVRARASWRWPSHIGARGPAGSTFGLTRLSRWGAALRVAGSGTAHIRGCQAGWWGAGAALLLVTALLCGAMQRVSCFGRAESHLRRRSE